MRIEIRKLKNGKERVIKYINYKRDYPKKRAWLILARNKATGELFGYTEESFRMAWSRNKASVRSPYLGGWAYMDEEKPHSYLVSTRNEFEKYLVQAVKELQANYPKYDIFATRVGSKKCPVKVNWAAQKDPKTRANKSNVYFTVK